MLGKNKNIIFDQGLYLSNHHRDDGPGMATTAGCEIYFLTQTEVLCIRTNGAVKKVRHESAPIKGWDFDFKPDGNIVIRTSGLSESGL